MSLKRYLVTYKLWWDASGHREAELWREHMEIYGRLVKYINKLPILDRKIGKKARK